MARRTVMIDDFDGSSEATTSVRLIHDEMTYELDLSEANFVKHVVPLINVARTVEAAPAAPTRISAPRPRRGGRGSRDYDIDALRRWAASNNIKLPARGRIPRNVVEQFKQETAQ